MLYVIMIYIHMSLSAGEWLANLLIYVIYFATQLLTSGWNGKSLSFNIFLLSCFPFYVKLDLIIPWYSGYQLRDKQTFILSITLVLPAIINYRQNRTSTTFLVKNNLKCIWLTFLSAVNITYNYENMQSLILKSLI